MNPTQAEREQSEMSQATDPVNIDVSKSSKHRKQEASLFGELGDAQVTKERAEADLSQRPHTETNISSHHGGDAVSDVSSRTEEQQAGHSILKGSEIPYEGELHPNMPATGLGTKVKSNDDQITSPPKRQKKDESVEQGVDQGHDLAAAQIGKHTDTNIGGGNSVQSKSSSTGTGNQSNNVDMINSSEKSTGGNPRSQ